MQTRDYLRYIVEEIHSTVFATVDENGFPVTCAIDMMHYDDNGLYFLTAKGKSFYSRLKNRENIAFTAMKGGDTLSCIALSLQGKVREIGSAMLPLLFDKNKYMEKIYPTEQSRTALTVFQIYEGKGEWFDLSELPPKRATFAIGDIAIKEMGYFVTANCTGCKRCYSQCPQKCINVTEAIAHIKQENCLHCGGCYAVCPVKAIERR